MSTFYLSLVCFAGWLTSAVGQLSAFPVGRTPVHRGLASAHADALEIPCDPTRVLESVELRAACSEAVISLAGMTMLEAAPR